VKNWVAKKNISLEIKNGAGICVIRADEDKFMKILHHLLSNAIKFTHSGGMVQISTQFLKAPPDEDSPLFYQTYIEVAVTDTGIGIQPQEQEKIFSEFYQVDPNRSQDFEGTGLGLCITRELVKLHRGRIWVESEGGKGSKFSFVIPMIDNQG
jgi:signal transduction histidine kinase